MECRIIQCVVKIGMNSTYSLKSIVKMNKQDIFQGGKNQHINFSPLEVTESTESLYCSLASCDDLQLTFQDNTAMF